MIQLAQDQEPVWPRPGAKVALNRASSARPSINREVKNFLPRFAKRNSLIGNIQKALVATDLSLMCVSLKDICTVTGGGEILEHSPVNLFKCWHS